MAPQIRHRTAVVLDARVVTGGGGGPDKTILHSPRFLSAFGYQNLCVYLHPPGDPGFEQLRRKARLWEAPLISVPDHGPLDLQIVPRLLAICRQYRVEIWHGHEYKTNALGLLLRRFWPMHLVTTVHGWVQRTTRTPLYYAIDRLCLPRYERVICVSPDLYERCLRYRVAPERCFLVENGVDVEEYRRKQRVAAAKERLGFSPRRLLVGAIGRLSAEKGFDLLVRAADHVLNAGLDFELVIAGEGSERRRLQNLILKLRRQDRIQLLGYQTDVLGLYEAMDVLASSSLREGLPNVVLEAMAMEVPVIATRVAGLPRLIRHGTNGLLVEPGSVEALASALATLLQDGALRSRLQEAACRTVRSNHSFRTRMEKVCAIYDELLTRDGGRRVYVSRHFQDSPDESSLL